MKNDKPLRPVSRAELTEALAIAMRADKNVRRTASDFMSSAAAMFLAERLEHAGYVVMHKPPAAPPSVGDMHPPLPGMLEGE